MTRQRNDEHSTEFGLWLREYGPDSRNDGLDAENLDYILFNYKTAELRLIEEKRHKSQLTAAQKDTFGVIDQLLRLGIESSKPIKTHRGLRPIKYHGMSIVRFENTSPDDGWIEVDGDRMTREGFIRFLNFGRCLTKSGFT